jgi:putative NIF3 family GTP cyclohydrolase 1 type 2
VEEFHFTIYVESLAPCYSTSEYFRRGTVLNFFSKALALRVFEASKYREQLIVRKEDFLKQLKQTFNCGVIKYTQLLNKPVKKVAVCGGSGRFLLNDAIRAGADVFVTSDFKYHDYFDANDALLLVDIGHFESEQYTVELLVELLQPKFPTFAVLKSDTKTNPVGYFM